MSVKANDEIVRIVWEQSRPAQFNVIFRDGRDDLVTGHRSKAQAMADDLGLVLATDQTALTEWIREP